MIVRYIAAYFTVKILFKSTIKASINIKVNLKISFTRQYNEQFITKLVIILITEQARQYTGIWDFYLSTKEIHWSFWRATCQQHNGHHGHYTKTNYFCFDRYINKPPDLRDMGNWTSSIATELFLQHVYPIHIFAQILHETLPRYVETLHSQLINRAIQNPAFPRYKNASEYGMYSQQHCNTNTSSIYLLQHKLAVLSHMMQRLKIPISKDDTARN